MSEMGSQKYLVRDPQGNVYGPAEIAALRQWVQQGRIIAGMHIAAREDGEWIEVSAHPGLADLFRGAGPAQAVTPGGSPAGPQMPQGTVAASPAATTYPVTPVSDAGSYSLAQAQGMNMPGMLSFIAGLVATISLFMLCLPACGCPIGGVFSITAIILGIVGLQQIKAAPERYTGRGLALAGLTMGIIVILLYVAAIVVFAVAAARHHP